MKEKQIAKKLSAKQLRKLRGGKLALRILPPPITTVVSTPGHGRNNLGRKHGHVNDEDSGTADA